MSNAYFGEKEDDPGMTWIFGVHPHDSQPGTLLRSGSGEIYTVVEADETGAVRCIPQGPFITDEMVREWIA